MTPRPLKNTQVRDLLFSSGFTCYRYFHQVFRTSFRCVIHGCQINILILVNSCFINQASPYMHQLAWEKKVISHVPRSMPSRVSGSRQLILHIFPCPGLGMILSMLRHREIHDYNTGGMVTLPRLFSGTTPWLLH